MSDDSIINQLRENLSNYPEDTVLRELQQNADDAGAKLFGVIYSDEPSAYKNENPYLQSKKIIIFNDGPISDAQKKALFELRSASQIANEEKIGKFGLGLKSIFHWCDVCWCMQFDVSNLFGTRFSDLIVAPNIRDSETLIPDNVHEAVISDTREVLKKHIGSTVTDLFTLVLSIRDEASNSYLQDVCGTKFLEYLPTRFPRALADEHTNLVRNLPCLASLERVITCLGSKSFDSEIVVTEVKSGSYKRIQRFPNKQARTFWSLGYLKTRVSDGTTTSIPFAITVDEFLDQQLADLSQSDRWPTAPIPVDGVL
jgi:hypothetical protein